MSEMAEVAERTIPGSRVAGSTRPEWRVHCHDMLDRDRSLTVLVDSGRVVIVGPPGETAVLSGEQLAELRSALDEAATRAERSR